MKHAKLGLLVACGIAALGASAQAQEVNVTAGGTSVTRLGDHSQIIQPIGDGDLWLGQGGLHYSSSYDIGSQVKFESGSVAVGDQAYQAQSVSTVNLNVYSDNGVSTPGKLLSQIVGAGMGFYVSSGDCLTAVMGCSQTRNSADTFAAFAVGSGAEIRTLASVSFVYQVVQDDDILLNLTGTLDLDVQNGAFSLVPTLNGADTQLTGFTTLQLGRQDTGFGYTWAPTNVSLDMDPIPSGYSTITYTAMVTSSVNAPCLDDGACLLAYSGFGDPIGQGGAIDSNLAAFNPGGDGLRGAFQAGSEDGGLNSTCPNPTSVGPGGKTYINCVTFSPTTFNLPSFQGGNLTFSASAPEPASWALMIMGFGALGAAMRRRKDIARAV